MLLIFFLKTNSYMILLLLMVIFSDTVDKSLSLVQLGLDSLMAAEVKQLLFRDFKLDKDIANIRDLTLAELTDIK